VYQVEELEDVIKNTKEQRKRKRKDERTIFIGVSSCMKKNSPRLFNIFLCL